MISRRPRRARRVPEETGSLSNVGVFTLRVFFGGCNKMYFFTFSLQPFLHAETTKVLETVVSQELLVVFLFLGALK